MIPPVGADADSGPAHPKTGYMIESMVSAAVHNIKADIDDDPKREDGDLECDLPGRYGRYRGGVCGPCRKWPHATSPGEEGKWVHLAKIALEKYFRKMKKGRERTLHEKVILKALGIAKLEGPARSPHDS